MTESIDKVESVTLAKALLESLIGGTIQIASVIPGAGPVLSAAGTASFLAYQNYNFDRTARILQENINRLDRAKLDKEYLQSDEFKDLLFQFSEKVARTSSEERCDFLVKVFCGCFTLPTSTYSNKPAVMRLAGQMTNEEIQALRVIRDEEKLFFQEQPNGKRQSRNVEAAIVGTQLKWNYRDTLIICQSLQQLNLVYDSEIKDGSSSATLGDSLPGDRTFRITELGERLIDVAFGAI